VVPVRKGIEHDRTGPEPYVTIGEASYQWEWPSRQLEVQIDRVTETRDGMQARLTIWSENPIHADLLHQSRITLDSEMSRTIIVNKLKRRVRDPNYNWTQIIEDTTVAALEYWNEGTPVIDLSQVNYRQFRPHLLYPFVSGSGGTVVFADGSSSKTTWAEVLAVSVTTGLPLLGEVPDVVGPVLMADWEDDEYVHAMRLHAIVKGMGLTEVPSIFYQQMRSSLPQSYEALQRKVEETGAVLVVIDSLSAACGGGIEDSNSIGRFFDAARQLGVPYLVITHVTNEGAEEQATGGSDFVRPFGSRFVHNRARMSWGIEAMDNEWTGIRHLLFTNHKNNYGPKSPPQSYSVEFTTEGPFTTAISFTRTNPEDVPEVFDRLALSRRITLKLAGGGGTNTENLAEMVNAKQSLVESRLQRMRREGRVVLRRDGMWQLRTEGEEFAPDLGEDTDDTDDGDEPALSQPLTRQMSMGLDDDDIEIEVPE